MGQSRQNGEDASGACCPGGDGMEVGKGQQALARRTAFSQISVG